MKKLVTIVLFCLAYAYARSGVIETDLAESLNKMNRSEKIRVAVVLTEQFDIAQFKQQMNMTNSTRQERHHHVVLALQEIAGRSQHDLLESLVQATAAGEAANIQSYWIVNAVLADLSKNAIAEIAPRSDVEGVYRWREPELIRPIKTGPASPPFTTRIEQGLRVIGAPLMWALGYTGAGRLVANVDTGVDGVHPALAARWRGNNGHPASQCWLDTGDPGGTLPYDDDSHGTHTMGTITGLGAATGDTIGVAFGAQWIAARAIVANGNVISAFQWLVDPDGDPITIDDVPDVISNSWGYHDFTCPQSIWSLIDNCEAAEVAVVFAAGNRQFGDPYVESIWAPASRNTSTYNTFSVGAIDGNQGNRPIADFSARGPSQCDHSTIKPEVVAPGVDVRSSVPGGGYQQSGWSGTSMATPHVAGAIALLRQYNPNASVDTLKWALIQSAQDLGTPGEDNDYGYGLINVRLALNLVPPNNIPYLRIDSVAILEPNNNHPDPGDTIGVVVTLRNTGAAASNVYGLLQTSEPYAAIIQDSAFYGAIDLNGRVGNQAQPYRVVISSSAPIGRRLSFGLMIGGDGYSANRDFMIRIGQPAAEAVANHNSGAAEYTISNFAQYGLDAGGINPAWTGRGFRTPRNGQNYLYEGALLIGDGPTRVSNSARNENQELPNAFLPMTSITQLEPGPFASEEFSASFNDQEAEFPLNIVVNQTSYAFSQAPNDRYVIVRYLITNIGRENSTAVRVAQYQDWDIPWGNPTDLVNFNRSRSLGYQYSGANYRGTAVLNPEGAVAFEALHNSSEVYPPHFTMADKWAYMTSGFIDTAITAAEDASIMITTGPFDIPPGGSVVAAFAIVGGTTLAAIQQAVDAAIIIYDQITDITDQEDLPLPRQAGLLPNYPNPFNSLTVLRYRVVTAGQIKVQIFDILGHKVRTLVNSYQQPGNYELTWDATDDHDNLISSGVYFIRLTGDNIGETRRMTLIK